MSRFYKIAALAALALLPAVSGSAQGMMQNPPPPLPAGTPAPAFTTQTIGGKPLTLKSLRGKVVLLDYWATWCGPCQMATPTMESLYRKFGPKGLAVVGMSVDDSHSVANVKPFMKHFGMTYTVTASPIANGRAEAAYQVQGIPSQFLIDKKGIVRWSQSGFSMNEGPKLASMIKRLLAEH
jgi:thiol-disulfide isomerase/thioredoxin